MQAIITKVHAPTARHLNQRISATPGSGHGRIYIDVPDNMHADDEATHKLAAEALCQRLEWAPARLVGGAMADGSRVFTLDTNTPTIIRVAHSYSTKVDVNGNSRRLTLIRAGLDGVPSMLIDHGHGGAPDLRRCGAIDCGMVEVTPSDYREIKHIGRGIEFTAAQYNQTFPRVTGPECTSRDGGGK